MTNTYNIWYASGIFVVDIVELLLALKGDTSSMNTLCTDIGYRIKKLREAQHITQEQLAEEMDISVKHVSSVERGVANLSLERLVQICDILDCSLDYLVLGKSVMGDEIYFPETIIEILHSSDKNELNLFMEYIQMYTRIRVK